MLLKNTTVFIQKNDSGVFELWGTRLVRDDEECDFEREDFFIRKLYEDYKSSLLYSVKYATKNRLHLRNSHIIYQ